MRNLAQLMEDGYKPKMRQKLYKISSDKAYYYDKASENLDTGEISHWAWGDDTEPLLSDEIEIDPEEFFLHPWYPNKEIKRIEIIQEMPALKKGSIHEIEIILPEWDLSGKKDKEPFIMPEEKGINFHWNKQLHFYFMDFMLGFPQFFKPLYK